MPDSLRLFVAAYPPAEAARAMLEMLASLEIPQSRMVPADQVHLTLHFVGKTSVRDFEQVSESVERSCSGIKPGKLIVRSLETLPARGHARLVAAICDADPGTLELQRRLAGRLTHRPRSHPGDRFLAHLTLCRFHTPQRVQMEVTLPAPMECPVDYVSLMSSELGPRGARHVERRRFPLG